MSGYSMVIMKKYGIMFISNHVWIFMVIIQMMFGGRLRLGAGKLTGSRALNNHKVKMP